MAIFGNNIKSIRIAKVANFKLRAIREHIDIEHEEVNDDMLASSFLYAGCLDAPERIASGVTKIKDTWPFIIWIDQATCAR